MSKKSIFLSLAIFFEILPFYMYFSNDFPCRSVELMWLILSSIIYAIHIIFLYLMVFDFYLLKCIANCIPQYGNLIVFGWGVSALPFSLRIFIMGCWG